MALITINSLYDLKADYRHKPAILTVGVFDGVHIAHQKILTKLIQLSKQQINGQSVVFTFQQHPMKALQPEIAPPLLMPSEEKSKILESYGVDILINARFTKPFSQITAKDFIGQYLYRFLNLNTIVVGHDHSFGKGNAGTVDLLKKQGHKYHFNVVELPPYTFKKEPVSSSLIRNLLQEGKIQLANKLLTRPYNITGKVIQGRKVGMQIGFPTANLSTHYELIPSNGVYAVQVEWNGNTCPGVMNIGYRPTFSGRQISLEIHLLNFKGDLYGETLKVYFFKKIREEKRFENVDLLTAQIKKDIQQVKDLQF